LKRHNRFSPSPCEHSVVDDVGSRGAAASVKRRRTKGRSAQLPSARRQHAAGSNTNCAGRAVTSVSGPMGSTARSPANRRGDPPGAPSPERLGAIWLVVYGHITEESPARQLRHHHLQDRVAGRSASEAWLTPWYAASRGPFLRQESNASHLERWPL